jgi:thioredoxin-like negative regulator of GroEL
MIKRIVEELAQDYEGRVDVRKLDVDENQSLAQEYGVRSIPTLMLFKDGKARETVTGVRSKAQLRFFYGAVPAARRPARPMVYPSQGYCHAVASVLKDG